MSSIKIRDPIHNFIELTAEETKVVNLRVIQRLRGIRQLAMASLVYPGAVHTRFDHTLGVMHVAGLMAHQLQLDRDNTRLVRLAALLHDIGHGPFSHISESALNRFANRDELPDDIKKEKIHELITSHLIENDSDLIRCIGRNTCQDIKLLLSKGFSDPILKSIVSGPLDADKQDYLLRDTYFSGVSYGKFDLQQLHRSLDRIMTDGQDELAIKPDGIHAVEQFVMAKYYMTTMVYRHKVRMITDQMFYRAIVLGIEVDSIDQMRTLYTFRQDPNFSSNYLKWNDARFLFEFGESGNPSHKSTVLINNLMLRQLHKRVLSVPIRDFAARHREQLVDLSKPIYAELRSRVEVALGTEIKDVFKLDQLDPDLVIIHPHQIKSVRESSSNDEASILVKKDGKKGGPTKFEEESVLFNSINANVYDQSVEVFAPVKWNSHSDRNKLCSAAKKPLIDAITSTLNSS